MNVVLDTNVLVAAFLTLGTSREVLNTVCRRDNFIMSSYILDEFERVPSKKIGASRRDRRHAVALIQRMATVVPWTTIRDPIAGVDDAKDWPVLWFCHNCNAGLLVTGDQELIALERFYKVDIVTPRSYLKRPHNE